MARPGFLHLFALLWALLPLVVTGLTIPSAAVLEQRLARPDVTHKDTLTALGRRADKVTLRILPLGASLTWGLCSSSGNGYRKPLRDRLRSDGWRVNMVGSKTHGSMADNVCLAQTLYRDVEARSGDTIDAVMEASRNSLHYKANVVLINAGTNDARLDLDINNAGNRMRSLIQNLRAADSGDRLTIVLSTLIPSHDASTIAHRPSINSQYRELVTRMQDEGVPIVLADMDPPGDSASENDQISWPNDFYHGGTPDNTHPNDGGYAKMANVFYKGILDASDRGYLEEPYEIGD